MDRQELSEAVDKYGGYRPASRELGIPESTIRRKLKGFEPDIPAHGFIPDEAMLGTPHIGEAGVETADLWAEQEAQPGVRRYILTSAQNNCDVHQGFLHNLERMAGDLDAQILVSFTVYDRQGYRGVLARKGDAPTRNIWWDEAVKPHTCNMRARLARRLAFCGELDVLATAKRPLSGMDAYCGRSSIIVPHNRFAFKCVPSRHQHLPKELYTTGSITKKQFIQRKTGQLAHFHHVLGALLVEVGDDGYWFVHHLNADEDGSFYWLDRHYTDGTSTEYAGGIPGMILGDVHHEKLDTTVANVTLGEGGPKDALDPHCVVVHDLIDFRSRNHHNRKDPLFAAAMSAEGVHVEREILGAARFLSTLVDTTPSVVVAASNHDDAFARWIKETDWREDPVNAAFYLRTAFEMVRRAKTGHRVNPLQWAIQEHFKLAPGAEFLEVNDSCEVAGVECGMHGHAGPNGSRGSAAGFARLGFKTFTGHSHTPGIIDGCYTVGVMGKLDMDYNRGPSSWMHAHGIIYPNGKRAFVQIKNGRWRP